MDFDAKSFSEMVEDVVDRELAVGDILDLFSQIRDYTLNVLASKKKDIIKVWNEHGSPHDPEFLEPLRKISVEETGNSDNADASVALGWLVLVAEQSVREEHCYIVIDIHKLMGQLEMLEGLSKALVIGLCFGEEFETFGGSDIPIQ